MSKGWMYILVGGILEILWVVAMKYSEGFTNLPWTAVTFVFLALSLAMVLKAIGTGMPIGVAYSVWVGIGAVGIFVYGIFFMNDPADILRIVFMVMIISGIVGLQRLSEDKNDDS